MTGDYQNFKHELVVLLPRLWRFAYGLTGNRDSCGDLVQAACERALSRYHQFQRDSRLDSWVFTIASSLWKNELRAEAVRQGAGFVSTEESLQYDPREQILNRMHFLQIFDAVMQLPEAQRIVIILCYVEGYTYEETASILDIPIGTIMSRLYRARSKLADNTGSESMESIHKAVK